MSSSCDLLLISVSSGSGHVRAAQAIGGHAAQSRPDLSVEHIDMMDFVTRPMKKAIVDSYDIMIKQLPELWGFIYKKTNTTSTTQRYRELTKKINHINAGALYKHIEQTRPTQILCTHFLPASALLHPPKKYSHTIPISLLMTDYDKHSLLLTPGLHRYFVATKKMKWKLTHNHISPAHIVISGIPVDPVFYQELSVADLRKKYHLDTTKKTVLLLSGGQGMVKVDQIASILFELSEPLSLLVVTGNNTKLLQKLKKLTPPPHIDLHPLGWTDHMDQYMRLADVVITKPGGMTTSECMALQKPIIAIEPIPGQEEANAEYILESGSGVIAKTAEDLLFYVSQPPKNLHSVHQPNLPPPLASQTILNTLFPLS